MSTDETRTVQPEEELRDRALRRLKKKREFVTHLLVYVLVNACFVAVWLFTTGPDGFFWPAFLMVFWGIGVVMNAWDLYQREGFAEDEVRREMQRLRR